MEKVLSCSFQHLTGLHVGATFRRKRLYVGLADVLEDILPILEEDNTPEEAKEIYKEAEQWCKDNNRKRFESVEEASKYLESELDQIIDFDY